MCICHIENFSLSTDHDRKTAEHNVAAVRRSIANAGGGPSSDHDSGRSFYQRIRRTDTGEHIADHRGRQSAN
jgi:hypothetical protein